MYRWNDGNLRLWTVKKYPIWQRKRCKPEHWTKQELSNRRLPREDASLKAGITFTKPDKPLDAYNTWKEYYSDIDMEPTLKLLGFWRQK